MWLTKHEIDPHTVSKVGQIKLTTTSSDDQLAWPWDFDQYQNGTDVYQGTYLRGQAAKSIKSASKLFPAQSSFTSEKIISIKKLSDDKYGLTWELFYYPMHFLVSFGFTLLA